MYIICEPMMRLFLSANNLRALLPAITYVYAFFFTADCDLMADGCGYILNLDKSSQYLLIHSL